MALKENTTYSDLGAMRKSMKGFGSALKASSLGKIGARKAQDVSRFGGLRSQVKSVKSDPSRAYPMGEGNRFRLGTITTPYGGGTRYEKFHPGLDVANKIGTPVPSFTQGTVTQVFGGGRPQSGKGYGNYVIITDLQGNKHRYSHLNNSFVKVGQKVRRGALLGGMGNTGASYSTSGGTGSHLDYRVKNIYDQYIDPRRFVGGLKK